MKKIKNLINNALHKANLYIKYLIIILKIFIIPILYILIFTSASKELYQQISNFLIKKSVKYGFYLENIKISGQKNLPNAVIKSILTNIENGTPIFNININFIKNQLEYNDWIKEAIVVRYLPNTLHINIVERQPIAIWQNNNQLVLIDKEGHPIKVKDVMIYQNFPHVVGTDANIYASDLIENISSMPELANKIIAAIRYGERRWNLVFYSNLVVKMPESNFTTAWKFLITLYKENELFYKDFKIIDLRDPNKYYIEKNT